MLDDLTAARILSGELTGDRVTIGDKPWWLYGDGTLIPCISGGDGSEEDDDSDDDADGSEDDDSDDDSDDDDGADTDPAAEAEKWKKLARKHEDRAKANAKAKAKADRELADLRSKNLPESERALKDAEERGRTAAKAELAQELAAARIEAALTGVVDDPAELVEDLNLAKYVTDDGEVDNDAIATLRERWVKRNGEPDTGGSGGKPKPKTDLKQGNRGKGGAKPQLTVDDVKKMSPEAIEAARLDGRLNDVLGIKT